jgi:hypothetical protein
MNIDTEFTDDITGVIHDINKYIQSGPVVLPHLRCFLESNGWEGVEEPDGCLEYINCPQELGGLVRLWLKAFISSGVANVVVGLDVITERDPDGRGFCVLLSHEDEYMGE